MNSTAVMFIAWGVMAVLWIIADARVRRLRRELERVQHDYTSLKQLLQAMADEEQHHGQDH